MLVNYRVELSNKAEKSLKKLPKHIIEAVAVWVERIEFLGMAQTRKIKGYHDEPLKGDRKGQRSIRLSKSYRLIYEEQDGELIIILVLDINKHKY